MYVHTYIYVCVRALNFQNRFRCPAIEFNEQAKAGIEFGFEVDITNVNTTKIILNSGKFFIWAFVGAPLTFYVRVQYKFCSEVMDKCNNITVSIYSTHKRWQ